MNSRKLLFIALFCFTSLFTFEAKAATPVFVDAGNGTIVDTTNNLTWLKDANCFGVKNWYDAITVSNALASGQCGLTDGSKAGDWHLPTGDELRIYEYMNDTLNSAGFKSVQADVYWSSTIRSSLSTVEAFYVSMNGNYVSSWQSRNRTFYVWPVRSIDTTPPTVTLTSQPMNYSNQASGTIAFSANETAFFDCKMDSGNYAACTSPYSYNSLTNGQHTFSVRATDSASNISTPVSLAWTINTTLAASSAILLPQTGQTICYNSTGVVVSCSGTGQDGEMQAGSVWPDPRFVDNGDQTISDSQSGLIWTKNANLMATRNPEFDSDGTAQDGMVSWQHALKYVKKLNTENYLGQNDWRLPNPVELESLINIGAVFPVTWLTLHGFSNIQTTGYWTGSTLADSATAPTAWFVELGGWGNVNSTAKTSFYPLWPVRTGPSGSSLPKSGQTSCYDSADISIPCYATTTGQDGDRQAGVAWPSPRFTDNGNQSVTDNLTGLTWTKNANLMATMSPEFDADGTIQDGAVTWQHALDYLQKLNTENYLGYSDWRLPSRNELESKINRGQPNSPAWLTGQGFKNVQPFTYWSGSTATLAYDYAWSLSFSTCSILQKLNHNYVWPVRGGTVSAGAFQIAAVISVTPLNSSNQASGTFAFKATTSAAFECSLDGGAYAVCTSPYSYTGLADGQHTFAVRAISSANSGNISPPASFSWKVVTALTASEAVPLPKTGQTICYDTSGAVVTCGGSGQDGDLSTGVVWPSPRFTDNGNQSVTDTLTGLIWAKSANLMAVRYPAFDQDGTTEDGLVTWQHALDFVRKLNTDSYLGHTDWRLPNSNELTSLFNKEPANPATWLTGQGFTNLSSSNYWSGTTLASGSPDGSAAWSVNFGGWIGVGNQVKTSVNAVWPVRSAAAGAVILPKTGQTICYDAFDSAVACSGTGQDGELQNGAPWPIPRFVDNSTASSANMTVTDNLTGLIWAKNTNLMVSRDPSFDADATAQKGMVTWQRALEYVKKLNTESYLGHNDWRIPNQNELSSLINRGQPHSTSWLESQGFSNLQPYGYWSGTTFSLGFKWAWGVNYVNGDDASNDKSGYGFVWPVRSVPVNLTDTTAPTITAFTIPTSATTLVVPITSLTAADNIAVTGYCLTETSSATACSWNSTKPVGYTFTTAGSKTVSAFARDAAGNISAGVSSGTTITLAIVDSTPPTVTIGAPLTNTVVSSINQISGSASDSGSQVASVEIKIARGNIGYLQADERWGTAPQWIAASGTTAWNLTLLNTLWSEGAVYTVHARAYDTVGNVSSEATSTFTYSTTAATLAYTTITLNLSARNILQQGSVSISGKLARLPDNGSSMKNKAIMLSITRPDGTLVNPGYSTTTTTDLGDFNFSNLALFDQKGTYLIQTSFAGSAALSESSSTQQALLVGSQAGYAVIVQGKIPSAEGLADHNKITNRIYSALKTRGFDDSNILYYNYNTAQAGVDGLPDTTTVMNAITGMAGRINSSPAPFYLIMVDHGLADTFYLGNETVTPADVNSWLTTLESNLTSTAKAEARLIILGFCYSGSFIPALSSPGRIIITSATATEESIRGPLENDNIRSGELFLDDMFQKLSKGNSLSDSFAYAANTIRMKARKDSSYISAYGDSSVQHPMIADGSDTTGAITASGLSGTFYLGAGATMTNSVNPDDITSVAPTAFLTAAENQIQLSLYTFGTADAAWAEVRLPGYNITTGSSSGQLVIDLPKVLLTRDPADSRHWTGSAHLTNLYQVNPPTELPSGSYEIYYSATAGGNISAITRAVAYKNRSANSSPSAPQQSTPLGGEKVKTMTIFSWAASSDADGDTVSYTLTIKDALGNSVHTEEEIPVTSSYIPDGILKDATTYSWYIQAIDQYGAATLSTPRTFTTDNTNGLPGVIKGYLRSTTGMPLANATISTGAHSYTTLRNGAFLFMTQPGSYTISASATGYLSKSVAGVNVTPGKVLDAGMSLAAVTGTITKPGDCDGVGGVTIAEVQSAINMFLGLKIVEVCVDQDTSNNVTIAEVQKVINSFLGL